jgi:hyperosmotically inducible periplasmic protein
MFPRKPGSTAVTLAMCILTAIQSSATPERHDAVPQQRDDAKLRETLLRDVHHRLTLLPYYSVFDYLAFSVRGEKVTLTGAVLRLTLKADAEVAVKSIEGVTSVVNQIELLPASPMDDQLRRKIFQAIYGDTALSRYAIQGVPPIHIVVKSGNVALEGAVEKDSDRNAALLRASSVPNVLSVKNNLIVAGGGK